MEYQLMFLCLNCSDPIELNFDNTEYSFHSDLFCSEECDIQYQIDHNNGVATILRRKLSNAPNIKPT